MMTSPQGVISILSHEALILSTYIDGGGVPTIGVGHTALAGGLVPVIGTTVTVREGLQLFLSDLGKFEARVQKAIRKPIKQHEFDGFVSFDFNTGAIASGSIDDKWNVGNFDAAMKTLMLYCKDNGKEIAGLKRRREEERNIIVNGKYPRITHILVADAYRRGKYTGKRMVPVEDVAAIIRELRGS